jgi:hypothetical protein
MIVLAGDFSEGQHLWWSLAIISKGEKHINSGASPWEIVSNIIPSDYTDKFLDHTTNPTRRHR